MRTEVHQPPILHGTTRPNETTGEGRRSRRKRSRALVEAAKRGEPGSFEALYHAYLGVVSAVALAYGPLHEKDDIIQESFLLALEKLDTLKNPDVFGAWLRTITRNVAITHLRKLQKHEDGNDDVRDPSSLSETQRVAAMSVLSVVRALDEQYREIILMAYAEGMSGSEIADVTGLREGSVRVKLNRGLEMVRVALGNKKGRR